MKRSARALAALAFPVLALVGVAAAPAQASPVPAPDPSVGLSQLSIEDQALARSEEPKTILLDAETGAVISVERGETFPQGAVGTPINEQPAGDPGQVAPAWVGPPGCYGPPAVNCFRGLTTADNVSIFGVGITYGTWWNRTSAASAANDFMACWDYNGPKCSPRLGHYATAYWNDLVVGRAFTIF